MSARWVLLFLLCSSCKTPATLRTRDLPGFSIDLPSDEQASTTREVLDYRSGTVRLESKTLAVIVTWRPGAKRTPEELASIGPAMGGLRGGVSTQAEALRTRDGAVADTLRIEKTEKPLFISQVSCGGRTLLIATLDRRDSATHARVVGSLVCHPDVAAEKTLQDVAIPLRIDLPGFATLSHGDDGSLWVAKGDVTILFQMLHTEPTADAFARTLQLLNSETFDGKLSFGEPKGYRVPIRGIVYDKPATGFARLVSCPTVKVRAVLLKRENETSPAVIEQMDRAFDAATCVAADEAPTTWPEAKKNLAGRKSLVRDLSHVGSCSKAETVVTRDGRITLATRGRGESALRGPPSGPIEASRAIEGEST